MIGRYFSITPLSRNRCTALRPSARAARNTITDPAITASTPKIIAGQKPIITKAKKSVANFKVREGQNVGAKVTLRGDRMYYFADKLMNIVLPRVRDFRGIPDTSFDGRGNYAMGVKEQLIFPEISYDDVDKIRGMDIVFVTTAKTDEEARALLQFLGMPFMQA